ncbi:nicotinate-nucleotide adenylyltransferase [bacterium SCSIO 12643]|nr:nicotinate-nucleotide adenylyltransferase [bacterium SCSIO 12643]
MGNNNIGLFFGTFNPIHVGHLILANYMAQLDHIDQVWLVVTPKNPFKEKDTLLDDIHRLALVREAVDQNPLLQASNIEFDLPQPNYTVNTLAVLSEKYPEKNFSLIMGEDNLRSFHKWKNYQVILDHYQVLVYPRVYTQNEMTDRPQVIEEFLNHPKIELIDAPLMKISSSTIRNMIADGKDVRYMLSPEVHQYVDEMNFYKK